MKFNREKIDWVALAEEFKSMVENTTSETAVRVEVYRDVNGHEVAIDVYPAETNTAKVFYHSEELVDFCRCKGLSNLIDATNNVVRVHIY